MGTGFTTVNNYSGVRLAADGPPSNTLVPGYEPSKIFLNGGKLQLTASKGIDYLTNNNQLNILGVKLATVKKLQAEVDVVNPYNGTQAQQAGLWYGLNDKMFIKLTISGNKVELRKETNDISSTVSGSTNQDQRITGVINGLNTKTVRLRIVIDSAQNTAEGFYSVDGGATYTSTGAGYGSPLNIAGMGITGSSAYAGVYGTYRNGTSAVTYSFDDFSIQSVAAPVSQLVNINFQPANTTIPAGYLADTGLPFDAARKYGWLDATTGQPVSLQANMRARSGTGDARQLTLVQMQATTNGQLPGKWEYALNNGIYRVTVSAGDNGYYDSNNQINVEGLPAIADQIPSAADKYRLAAAVVQVNDGKLTIDANGGVNTKMNYITIAPATPVSDAVGPKVSARLAGTLKSAGVYDDQVQVYITASDDGGSGLAAVQYSINNSAYTDYKLPFTITAAGNYTLNVKAVDGNNNQSVINTYNFAVAAQPTNGAYMVLKNMDNFPSNDRLVFSLIQTPWRRTSPDTTPYNANHDRVRLRVNNKGTGKLIISGLNLSNAPAWKIVSVNSDTLAKMPVSLNTGTYADVTIRFIAKDAATRLKVFTDTLTITSNDSIAPAKKVILSGIWQKAGESTNEPYAQQIISAFGFNTTVGYGHDDGNIDGSTRVPGSSEVNAAYFVKADLSKPVTIYQMAAYHGCCSAVESIRYHKKGSSSVFNVFTHNNLDGQSVLPRLTGSGTNLAQGSFDPTGTFGLKVGSSWSDRTQNYNGLIGIRFLKVYDGNGNIVPDAYFMNCDYLGTSFTNYDYQDNIYYIENIRPDSGSVHNSELASLPVTGINFAPTLTGNNASFNLTLKNLGNTYPDGSNDPAIQLKSAQIVGPNANEFSIGTFTASSLAIQATRAVAVKFNPATVGIKNAALLISYNNSRSPLRIPLYGIGNSTAATISVTKRIKGAADVNVTIGNNLYEADKNYRKGSIKIDKQTILSGVAGTDIDSLYQTYLSAAADLAETRYEIPVPNGNYFVRMHFVENYWPGAGQRVFAITLENAIVLSNFDIFNEVGYRAALVKDFNTSVNDGVLNIKFNPTANRVALAAVELFKANDTTPAMMAMTERPVNAERSLIVYPNPNTGSFFNLRLTSFLKNERVSVSVTNTWGRLIQTQILTTDGFGNATIPVTFNRVLDKGVYMINANSASGIKMYGKLLVQ
ncbi:hypothetical protein GCM10007352_28640 [Mucilaginibacter phyllosphaerae]|nr:hypothetical protein GCM10007352_28640 [Mucilaginibacter phyllosphaerae]